MRSRMIIMALVLFAMSILACTLASNTAPAPQPISNTPAPTATEPPLAPTDVLPTMTPLINPASLGTPTISSTITATLTATVEATLAPITKAPPLSTGPLDFNVYLVGCRLDLTRDGGVILTIKIEATGGNGIYTYYREGQQVKQVDDRPATKGSGVIDAYRVTSSDGQENQKKIRIASGDFRCP